MQWTLVIMISLCWCEVHAKKCEGDACNKKMADDWNDNRLGPAKMAKGDSNFLQATQLRAESVGAAGVRRECRTLSDAELQLLFAAFKWLFTTYPPGGTMTRYQVFMSQHRRTVAPGAHFGPCFPPWHRQFILGLETALKLYNSTVNLCYWDSNLDYTLPNAAQSVLWTPEYFGNELGYVTTGFAANLSTYPPDCVNATTWPRLFRNGGGNMYLMNKTKTNTIFASCYSYNKLMSPYTSNFFESTHGGIHVFVDGHLNNLNCALTDPVFFFLHAYIDYLWELCRQLQTSNRETEYPKSGVPTGHKSTDLMKPMSNNTCLYGLSNNYIPGLYSYAPSPAACAAHADCNSKALWCNNGTCTSCVRLNGQMRLNWPSAGCYINGCSTPNNANGTCKCLP